MYDVAVVVPYYQHEPGILRRALLSVLSQSRSVRVLVVIVDDESPISATAEIDGVSSDFVDIRIVRKANGGPASARNAGLDSAAQLATYIAFLDSDDEWRSDHLARAISALECGHDFFFANHLQLGQEVGAFERAQRIDPKEHPSIAAVDSLYQYSGDLFNQIITGNVIGTSTVVFRASVLGGVRFREEFVYAGEDYLFWLDCALLTKRVAFSAAIACTYGKGVNVFSGSGWGTPRSLDRIVHETRFRRALLDFYSLTVAQGVHVRRLLNESRSAFVADVAHRLTHGKEVRMSLVIAQIRAQPAVLLSLAAWPLHQLIRRALH